MTTSLDLLKQTGTVVVSDSGDFECTYAIVHRVDHPLNNLISNRCLQATGKTSSYTMSIISDQQTHC